MSALWLNKKEEFLNEDLVNSLNSERNQLLTETVETIKYPITDLSMSWKTLGNPLEGYNVLSIFKVLKPKFEGKFDSKAKEMMSLQHVYEWAITMVVTERNLKVFEASLLLTVLVNLLDETTMRLQTLDECWDSLDVFGYSMTQLLDIIGEKLHPKLMDRLKGGLRRYFNLQGRVQKHSLEEHFQLYVNLKGSYDRYLRFRNVDGFFEGTLLPLFAVMGNDGSKLTLGVLNDTIEACILLHDTNNIVRHFYEGDIANVHRYTEKSVEESMLLAFARARELYMAVRCSDTDSEIKSICCTYILSFYSHANFCKRYGCGVVQAKAYDFAIYHNYIKDLSSQNVVLVKNRAPFHKIYAMYLNLKHDSKTLISEEDFTEKKPSKWYSKVLNTTFFKKETSVSRKRKS